ncbi:hypothetical protein HK105_202905 [Polyrhizophydium stewartii]|uniref:Uncharacterized protein n=1 Tax=Polyrhizophydium stewartii TaxID=2732419 RepID=A0ABR4NDK1_9FUNG|nr:hypothetical protein HK105_003529 [Polyrhizophydium stewartii]
MLLSAFVAALSLTVPFVAADKAKPTDIDTVVGAPVCASPAVKLNSHDCNVALLSLGGGIAGKIQFLRVAGTRTTGTSGSCQLVATAVDGGTSISISKGRLEAAFRVLKGKCGVATGSVVAKGGSKGGNLKIEVVATGKPAGNKNSKPPTPAVTVPAATVPASSAGAKRPTFKNIDISRIGGDGAAAIAAAKKVCPDNQSASQAEANRVVAEKAETSFFNAQLDKVKGNKASTDAIQCQKLRNKVLKQHCEVVRDTQKGRTASAAEHAQKRQKNADLVTQLCPKVNPALFVAP